LWNQRKKTLCGIVILNHWPGDTSQGPLGCNNWCVIHSKAITTKSNALSEQNTRSQQKKMPFSDQEAIVRNAEGFVVFVKSFYSVSFVTTDSDFYDIAKQQWATLPSK